MFLFLLHKQLGVTLLSMQLEYVYLYCCLVTMSCLTFVTPRTVARQAPPSMDFPGKDTGVGCHFLLQGIFVAQESNPHLLHWQVDTLPLTHQGSHPQNTAAAAAKSLQLCPTLCDLIDGRQPTRLPRPGILQARTLEWVAISFSTPKIQKTTKWQK